MDYQKLLLEHLDLVDRVVLHIGRRHHLSSADTEEFGSVVRLKLLDRDYAILRKFQGRSKLSTYLTTVIERLYVDRSVARWGKWRPSAAARRLGPVAVLLEQFVGRDGFSFDEAAGVLQTKHGVEASHEELRALFRELPSRAARRFVSEEELALVISHTGLADSGLEQDDDLLIAERVDAALSRVVAALPTRDQLILKLRYQDDLSVAQIGRLLHTAYRPIYQELQDLLRLLRRRLCEEGIDPTDVDRIVGHPAITLGRIFDPSNDSGSPRASSRGDKSPDVLGERDDGSV